jgi:Domain of unknown function (DUF4430)
MHKQIAALAAAVIFVSFTALTAQAAPTEVNVRIEGKTETLFEGPVLTDGHNVRGLTDSQAPAWGRRCDGLNNGANPVAGPTPTAASADAMAILGKGFDGDWYGSGSFDDYFITQWGPERHDAGEGDYWGVIVNNTFTTVGGCQYRIDAGDEVLWVYDAFVGRPRLILYPGDYPGGSVRLTAKATLGAPFEVSVVQWGRACCISSPPASPTRGTDPFEGAEVAPVVSTDRGFERIDAADGETIKTGSDGTATITFDTPGWHRIKATVLSAGEETAVRSNRLDVCVPAAPLADCGPLPSDDQVRTPPPSELEQEPGPPEPKEEPEAPAAGGSEPVGTPAAGPPASAVAAQVRIALRGLDRSKVESGIVGVGWRVRDAGAGISGWTVSSKQLGGEGARFVIRARGKDKNSARLRLPAGARYLLRLTLVDLLGQGSSVDLGTVRIPG